MSASSPTTLAGRARSADPVAYLQYPALAVLLAWPFLFSTYNTGLLTEILIFAIAAMSLDLLMGYGGLVSFGQAAFFGLGAYTTVILSVSFGMSPWTGWAAGVVVSAAAAAVIGFLCIRLKGVGFFMLTLAFAQLLFSAALKWRSLTGGSDGIGGMQRPALAGFRLDDPATMYFVALGAFLLSLVLLRLVVGSQYGHALVGIRDNEVRMRALGYRANAVKLIAFTVSGLFAGFSGGLYAIFNGFVSPDAMAFGLSGTILLMVVLGGAGSLVGPAIGAAVFLLVKQIASSYTEHWLSIVGIIFVACVMFFRSGIYGLLLRLGRRGS